MSVRVQLIEPVRNLNSKTLSVAGASVQLEREGVLVIGEDRVPGFFIPWGNVGLIDYQDGVQ